MKITQANMIQSLRAARSFLDANPSQLGAIAGTGASKRLDQAIADLVGHAENQSGSFLKAKGSTKEQAALRRVLLRDHMKPIARVARADLRGTPNIEPLQMPKGRVLGERLAAAARGMGQTAAKFAPVFVAAGLPADFVERLNAAADAMLASIDARAVNRNERVGATKGLKVKLSEGRKIVGVLDAFVQTALKDEQVLLAQWNSIKRVQLPTGGGRPADEPAQPAKE